MLPQHGRHIVTHAGGMVEVILHTHVVRADLPQQLQRLFQPRNAKTRNVEGVDRLHQQLQAMLRQPRCRMAEIPDQRVCHLLRRQRCRNNARQAVDARHAQCQRVVQRLPDAGPELFHAIRQHGNSTFAPLPVAGRQIDQLEPEILRAQYLRQLHGGHGIGELALHRPESCVCRRRKTIDEGQVRKQKTEVGAKTGHGKRNGNVAKVMRRGRCQQPKIPPNVQNFCCGATIYR